jgi:hypothetical protein
MPTESPILDPSERNQVALTEYECAQATAFHSDSIIQEVAAIVWGANTLLFGFILEVSCKPENELLVIVAATLGILMSLYVPLIQWLAKKGQHVAYSICREIEADLFLPHKLHTRIHAAYPRRRGQLAILFLTGCFVTGWSLVIHHALACLHNPIASLAQPLSSGRAMW